MMSAYDKALELLRKEEFAEGCMCSTCKEDRQKKIQPLVFGMVAPKIKFIPECLEHSTVIESLSYMLDTESSNSSKDRTKGNIHHYCKYCGRLHPKADTARIAGKWYCDRCKRFLRKCDLCGNVQHRDIFCTAYDKDGLKIGVCEKCFKLKEYIPCSLCHIYTEKETEVIYRVSNDMNGEPRYMHVCPRCNESGRMRCTKCGAIAHKRFSMVSSSTLCPVCYEEEQGLHEYWYKPIKYHFSQNPMEGKVSDKGFYMGFELEVAKYNSPFIDKPTMCHLIKEKLGVSYVYSMEDGTIERDSGYPGIEVVSHPFTWEEYKKIGYRRWDIMLAFLREKGWKANLPGIGFHVHTSKAAWGNYQIYKLLQVIYKNKEFVGIIAQREPNEYCRWGKEELAEAVTVAKDKKNRAANHYNTINLNDGRGHASNTIEFRMFQGSLEPLYVYKNIEFVYACYKFTQVGRDMTKKAFLDFIRSRRREFPCLNEFLNMKGVT